MQCEAIQTGPPAKPLQAQPGGASFSCLTLGGDKYASVPKTYG
jgi:hypothetical protein